MTEHRNGSIPWIDVQLEPGTTDADPELVALQRRFGLHPVVVKELTSPSPRARVEDFGDHLFLAYQFPIYDDRNLVSRRAEIDLIIARDAVVTVHYEQIHALDFAKSQVEGGAGKRIGAPNLQLAYEIVSSLLSFNQRQLRHIGEKVEGIAADLFTEQNRALLERISYLKRDISEYRIIFSPIGQVLQSLSLVGSSFFGAGATPYLDDLHGDFLRIHQQLEDYRGAVLDYESTNNQLMDVRTGEVMKVLTMMSFITFPLVLVAALFAVRLEGMPFLDHEQGFWMLIGLMALLALSFLSYFKHKRWI